MKFVLAVLVVLAVSSPLEAYRIPRVGSGALADEIQDFADILPLNKMVTIVLQYLSDDAEFQELVGYLQSNEFRNLIKGVEGLPELINLLNYMQNAGLDIYYLVNQVNAFIGVPKLQAPQTFGIYKITGGIRGFLDDIEAIFPEQKVKDLYTYKMANSKVFIDFMAHLRSPATQRIADYIVNNPNFTDLLTKAHQAGINVEDVKEFLEKFLGIKLSASDKHSVEFDRRDSTMKFALAVLAVLAMSSPLEAYKVPRVGTGALADELQDFVDILPLNNIVSIVFEYFAEDAEFQTFIEYMHSTEFRTLVLDIERIPEVIDLLNYMQRAGFDIYLLVNKGNKFLGLPYLEPPHVFMIYRTTGGIRGLLNEIEAIYPKQKVKDLFAYKVAHSKLFAEFAARLQDPSMQNIANDILADPNWNGFLAKITKAGIRIEDAKEFLERFFRIKIPAACDIVSIKPARAILRDSSTICTSYHIHEDSFQMKFCLVTLTALVAFATVNCHYLPTFGEGPLYEDIQYFLDMIPMKKVMTVTVEYAALDSEFQDLLAYFESDDFHQLLQEVENIPEFRVFTTYLQNNGVYINNVLNKLNKRVGIPPFQPILLATNKITGGLKGYFEDVKSYINYDLFIHGYVYKMRNSEAFRGFVAHLKSPNHQKFIDTLYQNQRYLNFRQAISSKGLDVALVEDIIFTVLGIEFPHLENVVTMYDSDLSKDINDFVSLVDKKKILKIVLSYLDDDEVQKAMTYMYSEDFHVLVRTVEGLKEYQDLVLYLHNAGLDIFGFLQKIHKLFGMENYVPPKVGNFAFFENVFVNRGGVKKMVDDVIDALPLNKFKQLYEVKMKNSPAFRNLIMKLRSEDLKEIVATIYKSPIFLEMRQKAIDAGLDLEPVRVFFKKVFNFEFPKVP
ncbi:uncharacterized protein LOC143342843 [Colletes latitarsis]|uniref:uncharacterized protein LOC143342843 n=1 Tax=Colletes latitarsis TaxID=2605962 RepID=UPI00403619C5